MSKLNRKISIQAEAAKLFSEKGFSASTMRDLALRVGIEPSSLYSHIRSKEEILRNICFETASMFLQGMQQIVSGCHNPKEQLDALIDLHLDIAEQHHMSVVVFNDEWRHLAEVDKYEFTTLRKTYESQFTHIIQQGIQTGVFKPVRAEIILQFIFSILKSSYAASKKFFQHAEQTKREIKTLILQGLINS